MKKTILNTMMLGLGLLYVGIPASYGATDEGKRPDNSRPVAQKKYDEEATPGDVKKVSGKMKDIKDKTAERSEEAGKDLKEAGKKVEKAVSTFFGRRDDKE